MFVSASTIREIFSNRLIDLTLPLQSGGRGVSFESATTIDRDGWNARTLHLYSHAGTHTDAPTHFFHDEEIVGGLPAKEQTIDRLPLSDCFSPAWVVDLPNLAPRTELHLSHLGETTERFVPGESLLLRTGWSNHWDQSEIYRDGLPRIAQDLAEWMVAKRVRLLGVEPPSVALVLDNEPGLGLFRHRIAKREREFQDAEHLHAVILCCDPIKMGRRPLPSSDELSAPTRLQGSSGVPLRSQPTEGVSPILISSFLPTKKSPSAPCPATCCFTNSLLLRFRTILGPTGEPAAIGGVGFDTSRVWDGESPCIDRRPAPTSCLSVTAHPDVDIQSLTEPFFERF